MGAGGSTAISSSSLDVRNKRQLRHQLDEHHHRMQKHRNRHQTNGKLSGLHQLGPSSSNMKQANSYYDLSTNHLLSHPDEQPTKAWFDTNQSEAYSLSNANIGASRPIMVLPSRPIQPAAVLTKAGGNAKKSNAGAASRIQQQRQILRSNELKKFSESLPSLNNLQPTPVEHHYHPLNHQHHNHQMPTNEFNACRQPRISSNNNYNNNYQKSAKQLQRHSRNSGQHSPIIHLVNKNDESSYQLYPANSSSEQLVKRAISLSSLHNLHSQQYQHHHHRALTHFEQQNGSHSSRGSDCKQVVSSKKQSAYASRSSVTPELMNNYMPRDLQRTAANHDQNQQKQAPHTPLMLKQQQQQHQQQQLLHYNQPTPLAKKILKFKQVSSNGGGQRKYNKYQQQQQQVGQHGCPVLPPLPRSQSLHELIQLRATENGQRMRTTGTLRGPLGGVESGNSKVNLVAELLESRRQQKVNETGNDLVGNRDSATMLSQSSSSDDGIHDVSLTGDQSTGDSRGEMFHKSSHRLSLANQQPESGQQVNKQRFFKRNSSQLVLTKDNINHLNRSNLTSAAERPQSQKIVPAMLYSSSSPKAQEEILAQQKSTLKRSVSHSALQTSLNHLDGSNAEEESDDLNELAKFLHQFKQRQTSKVSPEESVEINRHRKALSANQISADGNNSQKQQASSNLQQSPNSTTSSSGFASSTCTSNSISSSTSTEEKRGKKACSQEALSKTSASGRKKYPAPPRPDQPDSAGGNEQHLSVTKEKAGKQCLISGKLKLSSSLLSIVDEYNSTLQSNDRISPGPKLASLLLGEGSLSSSGSHSGACDTRNSRLQHQQISPTPNCYQQQQFHQLEQLKRYTQLRQMSQSELALNHLSSSPCLSKPSKGQQAVKGKRGSRGGENSNGRTTATNKAAIVDEQQSRAIKPYKSKLINLIRRISDKSEVSGTSNGAQLSISSTTSSVGGHQVAGRTETLNVGQSRTINQSDQARSTVAHSNQYDQELCARAVPTAAGAATAASSKGGPACLSESLCDLNFDCDLELIKNCGSNDHRGGREGAVRQESGSSLLLLHAGQQKSPLPARNGSNGCGANNNSSAAKQQRRRQKDVAKQHQVINSSKGENNWRLVPTSLSLAAAMPAAVVGNSRGGGRSEGAAAVAVAGSERSQVVGKVGRPMHKPMAAGVGERVMDGSKPVCKLHAPTSAADKLASHAKSKWSASSWLMNGHSGGGSKNKKQAASDTGESCLTKLISSSRTPQQQQKTGAVASSKKNAHSNCNLTDGGLPVDKKGASIESVSFAKVNSEANQLLDELDHSLDLVSAKCAPFSRKAALSWWQMDSNGQVIGAYSGSRQTKNGCNAMNGGVHEMEYKSNDSNGLGGGHSSSNNISSSCSSFSDDDDDDYANINRAMINATFDADKIRRQHQNSSLSTKNLNTGLSIEPGSPSDSFTFSIPGSPTGEGEIGQEQILTSNAKVLSCDLNQAKNCEPNSERMGKNQSAQDECRHQQRQQLKQSEQAGEFISTSYGNNNNNHVISGLSTATCDFTSQKDSSIVSGNIAGAVNDGHNGSGRETTSANGIPASGNACNLDRKRIVSNVERCESRERAEDVKRTMMVGKLNELASSPASNRCCNGNASKKQQPVGGCDGAKVGPTTVWQQQGNFRFKSHEHEVDNAAGKKNFLIHDSTSGASSSPNNNLEIIGDLSSDKASQRQLKVDLAPKTTALPNENNFATKSHVSSKTNALVSKCHCDGAPLPSNCNLSNVCKQQVRKKGVVDCRACCPATVDGNSGYAQGALESSAANGSHYGACCFQCDSSSQVDLGVKCEVLGHSQSEKEAREERRCHAEQFQGQSTWSECKNDGIVDKPKLNSHKLAKSCNNNKDQHHVFTEDCGRELRGCHRPSAETEAASSVSSLSAADCSENRCCGLAENLSERDLHNIGATFCRTTSTAQTEKQHSVNGSSEDGKLIIQRGYCHCLADSYQLQAADKSDLAPVEITGVSSPSFSTPFRSSTANLNQNPGLTGYQEAKSACVHGVEKFSRQSGGHANKIGVEKQEAYLKQSQQQPHLLKSSAACCEKSPLPGASRCNSATENATPAHNEQLVSTRCKVVACHHPSSKLSLTNYNEDVKIPLVGCVSRDNLILKTGQRLATDESEPSRQITAAEKNSSTTSTNDTTKNPHKASHSGCHYCCSPTRIQTRHQHQALFEKEGKLVKRFSTADANKLSPNQTASNSPGGASKSRLLSGASRLISMNSTAKLQPPQGNAICRSNSELVSAPTKGSNKSGNKQFVLSNSGQQQQQAGHQHHQRALFGKLRNSLLSGKGKDEARPSVAAAANGSALKGELASSQLSLINFCGGTHYVSPFIGTQPDFNPSSSFNRLNVDFDDNFILKRKTPDAGLKSRC